MGETSMKCGVVKDLFLQLIYDNYYDKTGWKETIHKIATLTIARGLAFKFEIVGQGYSLPWGVYSNEIESNKHGYSEFNIWDRDDVENSYQINMGNECAELLMSTLRKMKIKRLNEKV